jgi:vancomycin resistance protein YoaR
LILKERLAGAWRHKAARVLLVLPALLVIAAIALGADYCCYRGKIYPGIYLNKISLGGLSLEEAEARLDAKLWSMEKLKLSGPAGEEMTVSLSELGISWDRDETMALIRLAGSGLQGYGGRLRRLWARSPLHLEGILNVEAGKLQQFLTGLARQVEEKPQDARFIVKGEDVFIEKEINGRYLQVRLLQKRLLNAVLYGRGEARLPIGVKQPELTAAKLAGYGVDRVMVAFSTNVSSSIPNRVHNIGLGADAINGCLLAPGEIFSFEEVVGEASREKGYREAPVIVGNKLVPGLGGGLCQVSSTLYNAALLANLEIIERYNHSLTIGYLPVGRDASISIGYADLKFKNTRNHHILIGAELKEGRLTFRLFGRPMEERVEILSSDIVRVEPPVHYEESSALPRGEEKLVEKGKAGYYVKTWRVVYKGDEEISRELLSHDYYRPVPAVYRVGTGD